MCHPKLPTMNAHPAFRSSTMEKYLSLGANREIKSSNAPLSPKSIIGSIRSKKSQPTSTVSTGSRTYSETDTMASSKRASTVKSVGKDLIKRLLRYISRKKGKEGVCASCLDSVPVESLVKIPCQHRYCRPCLHTMTLMAMKDERTFPPRCCTAEMPSKAVLSSMPSRDKVLFLNKMEELQTPATERWYCPAMKCGKWISPKRLRLQSSFQKCPYCRTTICSGCRGCYHPHKDCPADKGLDAVLERARTERWQQCFNCRTMVELTDGGCNNITCRCKANFCYKCGDSISACNCVPAAQQQTEQTEFLGLTITDSEIFWNDDPEVFLMITAMVSAEREEAEERERLHKIELEERRRHEKSRKSLQGRLSRLSLI